MSITISTSIELVHPIQNYPVHPTRHSNYPFHCIRLDPAVAADGEWIPAQCPPMTGPCCFVLELGITLETLDMHATTRNIFPIISLVLHDPDLREMVLPSPSNVPSDSQKIHFVLQHPHIYYQYLLFNVSTKTLDH